MRGTNASCNLPTQTCLGRSCGLNWAWHWQVKNLTVDITQSTVRIKHAQRTIIAKYDPCYIRITHNCRKHCRIYGLTHAMFKGLRGLGRRNRRRRSRACGLSLCRRPLCQVHNVHFISWNRPHCPACKGLS
eukprot:594419-Amphidinium_carterae.1